MTTENNDKKTKKPSEKGIAENEKRNETELVSRKAENVREGEKDDRTDIKETDKKEDVDVEGGSLSGNAAGNTPTEDMEKGDS